MASSGKPAPHGALPPLPAAACHDGAKAPAVTPRAARCQRTVCLWQAKTDNVRQGHLVSPMKPWVASFVMHDTDKTAVRKQAFHDKPKREDDTQNTFLGLEGRSELRITLACKNVVFGRGKQTATDEARWDMSL